ncbi:hypothetical protein [Planctomicrobium sp. SH527]|uniref:hypothetical protein n=1 Tax=Planctomicrobium sp. SH527 TaxID=3448123 RepID=UPI003F5B32D8
MVWLSCCNRLVLGCHGSCEAAVGRFVAFSGFLFLEKTCSDLKGMFVRRVLFVAIILMAVVGFWVFRPKPKTHTQKLAEAKFARPTTIDTQLAEGLQLKLGDTDWLNETPTVSCGDQVDISVTVPKIRFNSRLSKVNLRVVPRLADRPDSDFSWHSFRTDTDLGLKGNQSLRSYQIRVAPGNYQVRFYIEIGPRDLESGELPRVSYIGTGRLIVTPPADGSECKGSIPNKSGKGTFSVKTGT